MVFESRNRTGSERLTSHRRRSGLVIVLTALLLVFFLGMIAFAVDLGIIANTRTELQMAADAAAYAGAGALVNGSTAAVDEAKAFYGKNRAGGATLTPDTAVVEVGQWDPNARKLTIGEQQPNAVRVTSNLTNQGMFFGSVLGKSTFDMNAQAVATYLPRDIVLVLDYSGSMCYDSQFRNLSLIGQPAVEANLRQIWQELGAKTYGTTMTFEPVLFSKTSQANVKQHFNFKDKNYPYPGGSWDDYIDFVQNDNYVDAAGYKKCYGLMTLVDYWLSEQTGVAKTPGMAAVSQQPLTALKDAVDVFLSYLTSHGTDDRVGLSLYSSADGAALLEQPLTKTYPIVSSIVRSRQAGHYVGGTNISAGMNQARLELQNHARLGAKPLMILMTDGVVNLPTGNTTKDKAAVIAEANAAAAAKIPIVTIALGAYADTALMQQVADITGGACFIVPGGRPIAAVQKQLEAVFSQVAADRPLKLVQ